MERKVRLVNTAEKQLGFRFESVADTIICFAWAFHFREKSTNTVLKLEYIIIINIIIIKNNYVLITTSCHFQGITK